MARQRKPSRFANFLGIDGDSFLETGAQPVGDILATIAGGSIDPLRAMGGSADPLRAAGGSADPLRAAGGSANPLRAMGVSEGPLSLQDQLSQLLGASSGGAFSLATASPGKVQMAMEQALSRGDVITANWLRGVLLKHRLSGRVE